MSDDWTRDLPPYLFRSIQSMRFSMMASYATSTWLRVNGDEARAEAFTQMADSMARSLEAVRQTIAESGPEVYPRLGFEIERLRWLNEGLSTNN